MGRQQQLVIMIKSPEKQYNAYRILKVLANQDYLAVDYSHAYYVLSPAKTRYNIRTKTRPIQNRFDDIHKILKPKQCIQIDRIHYYVFFIGQHEVVCANNFETAKIKSHEDLLAFFKGAVEQILKHMLMKDSKEARKVIDIKNCIIVKRRLYLLQLDRGRMFPRSLEKSEKWLIRGKQDDSFQSILENQLKIIKYFGLLMWEIIYKTPYPSKRQKVQANQEQNFLKRLLGEIVSKKITYEYICIRIREQESMIMNWKGKRLRKVNSLMKKEVPRYKTESMSSNEKYTHTLSRMRTESHKKNISIIAHRKVRISQIKTGEDSIQTFQSRLPKFNERKLKLSSIYRSTGQNSSFRDSRSRISIEAHQKLQKQSQLARNLFKRFVQAKFHLRGGNDDEIGQNLRSKLVSKIERFKTEMKSHSRQKDQHYNMSQKNVLSNLQSYESLEPITKKLDFNQSEGTSLMTTAINLAPTQREDRQESNRAQPIYQQKQQPKHEHRAQSIYERKAQAKDEYCTQPMDEPKPQIIDNSKKINLKQEIIQQSKTIQPSFIVNTANTHKQDKGQMEEQIEFEVINLTNISQDHQPSKQTVPQPAQRLSMAEKQQAKQRVQMAQRKQKIEQLQKRNNIISQPRQSTDQIEVITIKKTDIQKPVIQQSKSSLKQQAPKPKSQKIVIDKLIKQIEQYESLISILGDISTRAIRIKSQLSSVQWKRAVYFIYERFIYERSRFEQALLLGARQLIRKNRTHNDQQWDEWQKSNPRKQLIAKIQQENRLLKGLFNNFATKIPFECKFQRKIDYYARNRDKLDMAQMAKIRHLLAKYTAKYVIEIYNTLIDHQITRKEILSFMEDCLYACFIMGELDDKLPEARWMKVGDYRKYSCDLQTIDLQVQLLYTLYFDSKNEEDVQT